jgi:sugar/nucleoside kinase (ribokinase family)
MEHHSLDGRALYVGQAILDCVTYVRDVRAEGKEVALRQCMQAGGNAFTAGITTAVLGYKPSITSGVGNDTPGRIIEKMVRDAGVYWHPRAMTETPWSNVLPNPKGRFIAGPEDELKYTQEFVRLDVRGCPLIHFDGRQLDAAEYYMAEAQKHGVPTSIDVGRNRPGIEGLLYQATYPSVSESYCRHIGKTAAELLTDLHKRGRARFAIVTMGKKGLLYIDDTGVVDHLAAFPIDDRDVLDENAAGDIFNGARNFSMLTWPERPLVWHLLFAMAAVICKLRRFGNFPPTLDEVLATLRSYGIFEVTPRMSGIA